MNIDSGYHGEAIMVNIGLAGKPGAHAHIKPFSELLVVVTAPTTRYVFALIPQGPFSEN
jgi:hypothetical protein